MKHVIIFLGILFLAQSTMRAQEIRKFKVTTNIGVIPIPGAGLVIDIEPKYALSDKNVVGLQLRGTALIGRVIQPLDANEFDFSNKGSSGLSAIATFDRALGKSGNTFQPYVGGGLGFYKSRGDINATRFDTTENFSSPATVANALQPALMLRGGLDIGRFRLGLDYTFIPGVDVISINGETIGTVKDRYLGVTIGLTLGGGKKNTSNP